ncbi:MAG: RagB/SusD family nutrient uptake outer membrane protein [Odoribacteraceae bacterium]|jgi:hypothetical protein|nr:RagB/SusD family nutrient uptake outer membrane protein [Odoribacteraceae bacterium]
MKNTSIIIALVASLTLFSCEEWLNVKPRTTVESSELFQNEAGYKDALWGIYTQMTSTAQYGRELTFGMTDILGQVYYNVGTSSAYAYYNLKNYAYTAAPAEALINASWQSMYATIANINNLVDNLRVADKGLFDENHYNVILGEALALRAFLHFDLARLFAPSYLTGADQLAIPYVKQYTFKTTPRSTVQQVIGLVLEDLTEAEGLLRAADPIYTNATASDEDALLVRRYFHANYYAVKAMQARVYLYKGDVANAGACAKEVIESGKFTWTPVENIAVVDVATRDRTFSTEQVFALQVQKLEDHIADRLTETIYVSNRLTFTDTYLNRRYPAATHANDWRRLFYWSDVIMGTNGYRFCNKLWQVEEMTAAYAKRMPLIRLPELYLIAAEADIAHAADYLNAIREHRGILAPVTITAEADLRAEIRMEYLREFACEGVIFYYYKRLDATTIDGLPGAFNTANYVLPTPKEEIEYGQREQEL